MQASSLLPKKDLYNSKFYKLFLFVEDNLDSPSFSLDKNIKISMTYEGFILSIYAFKAQDRLDILNSFI